MSDTVRRVTVTGPRRTPVRRTASRHGLEALDEQDQLGQLLVRSLVRAQLGLAMRVAAVVSLVIGGLPLLFAFVPTTGRMELLGMRLPWLLLGVLVYPVLVLAGWVYVRLAERNERDFVDLVERT